MELLRRAGLCRAGVPLWVGLVLLGGCAEAPAAERLVPSEPAVEVVEDLTYWSDERGSLQLDACLPGSAPPGVRAVVLVHGGGFTSGGRQDAGVRALCQIVAESGQAAFSIDYRKAPTHTFPTQVDDLASAVTWLREPAQVQRFGIDPARVGVIGSSAGAILAQSLATRGEGPLDSGSRVAAVVSLSGVSVLGPEGLRLGEPRPEAARVVLDYLGCEQVDECPRAREASPLTSVDPSDPPMLLVNGSDELVPRQQAEVMAETLTEAGVPASVTIVDGHKHGLALLDAEVRRELQDFLREQL